jgi:hypothetical protein
MTAPGSTDDCCSDNRSTKPFTVRLNGNVWATLLQIL